MDVNSSHWTRNKAPKSFHFVKWKEKKCSAASNGTRTQSHCLHVINIGPIMRRVGRRPSNSMNARRRRIVIIIIMNAENDSAESPCPSRPKIVVTPAWSHFHCDIFRTIHWYGRSPACPVDRSVGQPSPASQTMCVCFCEESVRVSVYFECHRINFTSIWLYFSALFLFRYWIYLLFVLVFGIYRFYFPPFSAVSVAPLSLCAALSLSAVLTPNSLSIYLEICLFIAFVVCPISPHRLLLIVSVSNIYYLSSRFVCLLPFIVVVTVVVVAYCLHAAGLDSFAIRYCRKQCRLEWKIYNTQIRLIIIYINDKWQWRARVYHDVVGDEDGDIGGNDINFICDKLAHSYKHLLMVVVARTRARARPNQIVGLIRFGVDHVRRQARAVKSARIRSTTLHFIYLLAKMKFPEKAYWRVKTRRK